MLWVRKERASSRRERPQPLELRMAPGPDFDLASRGLDCGCMPLELGQIAVIDAAGKHDPYTSVLDRQRAGKKIDPLSGGKLPVEDAAVTFGGPILGWQCQHGRLRQPVCRCTAAGRPPPCSLFVEREHPIRVGPLAPT